MQGFKSDPSVCGNSVTWCWKLMTSFSHHASSLWRSTSTRLKLSESATIMVTTKKDAYPDFLSSCARQICDLLLKLLKKTKPPSSTDRIWFSRSTFSYMWTPPAGHEGDLVFIPFSPSSTDRIWFSRSTFSYMWTPPAGHEGDLVFI